MPDTIRTAYAVSTKHGCTTYRARAYVAPENGGKHTFIVALGDTAEEAINDCLKYIRSCYAREELTPPATVVHTGKGRGALIGAYLF